MLNRALVVLLGLGLAACYGIGLIVWYGPENLLDKGWAESVFWALASSGVVLLAGMELFALLRSQLRRLLVFDAQLRAKKQIREPGCMKHGGSVNH